jgi:GTPase SAR1 family protein
MDPRFNPYAPGAGAPPPALAGRDLIIDQAAVSLDRIRAGRYAKSLILVGLRGVGKTVLLNRIQLNSEATGILSVRIEAPEGRSLPGMLAPALRATLLKLDRTKATATAAKKALRALAGFVGAMKIKYADVEMSLDVEPERGLADTTDLDIALTDLLLTAGEAAQSHATAIVICVDELQYVEEDQLASLITALHRCAQKELPITLIGAGLPQIVGQTGRAKSYAERLFDFAEIGPLDAVAASIALSAPAEKQRVFFDSSALEEILAQTRGYPYFLQEWGKHAWSVADASPISVDDVRQATIQATADLDASFFRVRFDRLTPAEKGYLRAMAELGAGPHRSGDIAEQLGRKVNSLGPTRSALIAKGMVYSPEHGDTAFTVPFFDQFMKRVIPRTTSRRGK